MMAEQQKSIFIRFNMDDKNDRELYMKLTGEAGSSASLTAYVKRVLEEYFTLNIKIADRQEFHNQMLSAVREEMQSQGMKLVGALLAGIAVSIRLSTIALAIVPLVYHETRSFSAPWHRTLPCAQQHYWKSHIFHPEDNSLGFLYGFWHSLLLFPGVCLSALVQKDSYIDIPGKYCKL